MNKENFKCVLSQANGLLNGTNVYPKRSVMAKMVVVFGVLSWEPLASLVHLVRLLEAKKNAMSLPAIETTILHHEYK